MLNQDQFGASAKEPEHQNREKGPTNRRHRCAMHVSGQYTSPPVSKW
jgi:hypothetical protein